MPFLVFSSTQFDRFSLFHCVRHRVQRGLELKMAGLCIEVALHVQVQLGSPPKATYISLVRLCLEAGFMDFKNAKALYLMHMHIPVRSIGRRVVNIPSLNCWMLLSSLFPSSSCAPDFQTYFLQIPSGLVFGKAFS
jgi:hypothetical protein